MAKCDTKHLSIEKSVTDNYYSVIKSKTFKKKAELMFV